MSVNLATKYSTKLDERFVKGSYTEAFVGNDYEWDGVNAIKVWTLLTDDLNDYNPSGANRFGTPSEVDDEINTYALTKKRSFAKTFDVTNVADQMFVKKANAYLKQMWDERYIPEIDTYRLATWANGAGTVAINGTALTASTILAAIRAGMETLDDNCVPSENRVIFVKPATATLIMMSDEMKYNKDWTSKSFVKGQITEFLGAPVVVVPSTRFPAGCNFIIKYKRASADPMKLRMLRANEDVPGLAGTLMEGLCRYDSFVLAQKAIGIYAHFKTGAVATPTIDTTTTSGKVTIATSTGSSTIKYTTDGSNPKTSATALTYSEAFTTPAAGTVIKAYASKSGNNNSGIATFVVA